jgi:hypothetical protein
VRPSKATPISFWAEKLILVIIHPVFTHKSYNKYIARFLGETAHFYRPRLHVDRFSIVKKHFFINSNVKGFFLQQHCFLKAS